MCELKPGPAAGEHPDSPPDAAAGVLAQELNDRVHRGLPAPDNPDRPLPVLGVAHEGVPARAGALRGARGVDDSALQGPGRGVGGGVGGPAEGDRNLFRFLYFGGSGAT